MALIEALAPRPAFVGSPNASIMALLSGSDWNASSMPDWARWALIVVLAGFLYLVLVIKLWNWFLSFRGPTTPEDQREDDEEQARYLEEQARRKRERKKPTDFR